MRLVCYRHADLPALDPDFETLKMRLWWLERYTLTEIRALAVGL
jgi:hypothetical protein